MGNFHTSAKLTSGVPWHVLDNVVGTNAIHKLVAVVKSVEHCAYKCAQGAFAKSVCLLQDVCAIGKVKCNVF